MKALSVTDIETFSLEEIEKPRAKAGNVVIKVAYCGICGSDIPRYFNGGVHSFPQILGHEFSGVVEEIGDSVNEIKVGDRVAVAPLVPCGSCEYCQKGEPAMCKKYSFIGSRQAGAMAEFVEVPERNCVRLPENLSLKEAALVEPLTVAIHGVDRVDVHAGAKVMVLGAGTIGLLTLLTLRAKGVGEIIVVDLNQRKLDLAKKIGADVTINPKNQSLENYFSSHELPEIVYETAGSNITQVQAVEFARKKGKVVFIGTCTKDVVFKAESFEKILRNELEITGSWMSYSSPFPGYEWTAGLRYMATKEIDVTPLITGKFKLEDKEIPFEKMVEKDSDQIKLLYKIHHDIQ
ncbi:galactitol-1-phosphate 5-dehydrogenase [Bacillus sp. FJAT-27225]|uniref:galactitol-1-phosphate 5-dehydrogenase n=1 Tax=Bacillus sp. FJAT-27225 TaxID=1743144 RepID=UPI00080C295F|nr:galactitol-1-phosphate 5-dehydrogenase [Bacillus sp. FJAT-27225]OCA86053.1 galactitol-1-phosphate 5-dehydrogenase [Bacillus sp. FJAT-27225]